MNEYEVGISFAGGTVLKVRADYWETDDGHGSLRFLKRDRQDESATPLYTKVCEVGPSWWLWVKQVNLDDDGEA